MRALAGCLLLFAAPAAFPQAGHPDDLHHGPAGTYRKVEIRPGIMLGVQYDPHGAASHMDIFAVEKPEPPSWRRKPIPGEIVDAILDEILPPQSFRKQVTIWCMGYPCHEIIQAQGAVIHIAQRPLRPPYQVEDVAIDFTSSVSPQALDPPVPAEAPRFR